MNPVSVDVKDLLEEAELGTFGDDLFIGKEPSYPDECIVIYDTGGADQNPKLAIDENTIQLRCRSNDYLTPYNKLQAIKLFLEGKSAVMLDGVKYVGFWAFSNIMFLNYDENDRAIWVANFRIIREPDLANVGNRLYMGT